MQAGQYGWIEIALFYGLAIGFGVWQFVAMDRKLKKTRAEAAEKAAREVAEREGAPPEG
jgi:hypothetical protein